MDDDNEVRDRATFYLNVLEQKQKALNAGYILNGESSPPCHRPSPLPELRPSRAGRPPLDSPGNCRASLSSQKTGARVGAAQRADLHVPSPPTLSKPLPAPVCSSQQSCRGGCPEKWGFGGRGGFPRVLQP